MLIYVLNITVSGINQKYISFYASLIKIIFTVFQINSCVAAFTTFVLFSCELFCLLKKKLGGSPFIRKYSLY